MARELHTPEEIRDEVARILNEARKMPIRVPLPTRTTFEDVFEGAGSNWQMPVFAKVRKDDLPAIGRAIRAVKSKWNLKE